MDSFRITRVVKWAVVINLITAAGLNVFRRFLFHNQFFPIDPAVGRYNTRGICVGDSLLLVEDHPKGRLVYGRITRNLADIEVDNPVKIVLVPDPEWAATTSFKRAGRVLNDELGRVKEKTAVVT